MCSSTKSVRPEYNRLAGRCTCSGVDRWMNPASLSDAGAKFSAGLRDFPVSLSAQVE